jgi:hypothetical protein
MLLGKTYNLYILFLVFGGVLGRMLVRFVDREGKERLLNISVVLENTVKEDRLRTVFVSEIKDISVEEVG